ncbi:MAG: hypothetical protein ACOYL3_08455 [Desulfuromonadaceae bacterium]
MILETIPLGAALTVTLIDQTRHYFGGYYHVKLLACCDIPLEQSYFESAEEYCAAVGKLGTAVRFERVLEKMAVPEAEIATVRTRLTDAFHETSVTYLSSPGFAPGFVRSEYQKCMKKAPHMQRARA